MKSHEILHNLASRASYGVSVVGNLDQLDPSLCGILTSPDDHRMLVEPSCGAGLAAAYSGVIKQLQQDGRLPAELSEILLVVCGGHCITMEMLEGWKKQFGVHWMYGRSALSHIWGWNLLQATFPRTGLSSSKENLHFPITNINPRVTSNGKITMLFRQTDTEMSFVLINYVITTSLLAGF